MTPKQFKLTATDLENIEIARRAVPALTSDVDVVRHSLALYVTTLDPAKVRKIRRELQEQQQAAEVNNVNA